MSWGTDFGSNDLLTLGNVTGLQLISSVADGTAPLIVTSTTVVANLNADQLDGIEGSALVPYTGADKAVDLGTQNLITTGQVTTGALRVEYPVDDIAKFKKAGSSDDFYFFDSNTFNCGYDFNGTRALILNYVGYQRGATQFRDFRLYNGKGVKLLEVFGSTGQFDFKANALLTTGEASAGSAVIGAGDNRCQLCRRWHAQVSRQCNGLEGHKPRLGADPATSFVSSIRNHLP